MNTTIFINGKQVDMYKEIIDTEKDLKKDEIGFTYVHQYSMLSLFKMNDFLKQVKLFQNAGMSLSEEHIYNKQINGKSYIMIVFTPKKNSEEYWCPMALALGNNVFGFTYIIHASHKRIIDAIKQMLKVSDVSSLS